MPEYEPVRIKLWGDYACFTRPEMKVERTSYEVPTPSALRGTIQSIHWKPEFRYAIREIRVLRPIRTIPFVRNEATGLVMGRDPTPVDVTSRTHRVQRYTLALRDVAYEVVVDIVPVDGDQQTAAKHRDILRRRLEKGQCFRPPYFGCREFAAHFAKGNWEETNGVSRDLGLMLFDLRYDDDGTATPIFFDAQLHGGVLRIPPELYEEGWPR